MDYSQQIKDLEIRQMQLSSEIDKAGHGADEKTRDALNRALQMGPAALAQQKNSRLVFRIIIISVAVLFMFFIYGTGHPVWGTLYLIFVLPSIIFGMSQSSEINIGSQTFVNRLMAIDNRRN